ncbi:MAG: putative rane protein [Akkermansiaceae bacterium]|nr:putative rane protein [Akkermansiaceae bacterium]
MGPVPFADLKELARSGEIDPRRDLVWSRGMTDWSAAGDVEGLFSRRAAPTLVAKDEQPYVAPKTRVVENWKGATPTGTGRAGYFVGMVILPVVLGVIISVVVTRLQHEMPQRPWVYLPFLLYLFIPVITIFTTVTRLKNVGMSGWWFFGTMVPILNIWVGYRCFACPADYAYAKKLDSTGVFLALLYWGWLLLVVAGFGFVFYQASHSAEFREKLEKLEKEQHRSIPWEVKDRPQPAARPVQ